MEIKNFEKTDNRNAQNIKLKKQKKIKIILVIIGVILIFSALRSIYYIHKQDRGYEVRGWQTASATCTKENSYTRTSTR